MAKLKEKLEKIDELLESVVVAIDQLQNKPQESKQTTEKENEEIIDSQLDEKIKKIEELTERMNTLTTKNKAYEDQLDALADTAGGETQSIQDAFAKYRGEKNE